MISAKIIGVEALQNELMKDNIVLSLEDLDIAMNEATKPIIQTIKSNYKSLKHVKTGALIDSIQAFRGGKKSKKYDRLTYYVGPKYSTKNSLSAGGNAAHLLEWGTKVRQRADKNKGGFSGKGVGRSRTKIYGAKIHLGGVQGSGVLRRSYDETKGGVIEFLYARILRNIESKAKLNGFKTN